MPLRIVVVSPTTLLPLLLFCLVAVTITQALTAPSPPTTVVYGPQSRELLLLVAKLAASSQYCFGGSDTSTETAAAASQQQQRSAYCICAPGTEEGCRRLLYSTDYADAGIDEEGHAKPISDPENMSVALGAADSLVLVATEEPVDGTTMETFLKYTTPDLLKKIVLISTMGVTGGDGGGGFFGGGGRNQKQLESETTLKKMAKERNLEFSIIRAGICKGGGPSVDDDGQAVHEDLALSKAYYNTILDVVDYKVTLAHDTFSLGATTDSIVAGDPHTLPNRFTQMGTKASFDPSPTDSNRIVVAAAAVAALYQPPVEVSVGTAAGTKLPTLEELSAVLGTYTTTQSQSQ